MKITSVSCYFKGTYLSNALAPGRQRDLAKQLRTDLAETGLDMKYENEGYDILINPGLGSEEGIYVEFAPHTISRVLNDDYDRWHGRLY